MVQAGEHRQMDRQTDKQTDKQTKRQMDATKLIIFPASWSIMWYNNKGLLFGGLIYETTLYLQGQMVQAGEHRQMDRQTDKQTDKQTKRQMDATKLIISPASWSIMWYNNKGLLFGGLIYETT